MPDFEMPYFVDGGGNKGYFKDTTARDQIDTKIEGLVYPREDHTSLTEKMDNIKAQGKNGAYIMYCSSVNPDFATIGYCTAIGLTINTAVSVIAAINSQTGDIWTNGNTSQNTGDWIGWKKVGGKTSGVITASSGYTVRQYQLAKVNGIVYGSFAINGTNTISGRVTIGTIPSGFRPSMPKTLFCPASTGINSFQNCATNVIITETGNIVVGDLIIPSGQTIKEVCCTFAYEQYY